MKRIFIPLMLISLTVSAQINFDEENVLINNKHILVGITDLFSADLNNDTFKDLIVCSSSTKNIIWYKNVNGDLYHQKPLTISEGLNIPKSLFASDMNNDGLIDVVATSQFDDKIVWYQNLGNDSFSSELVIGTGVDDPRSVVVGDINNDGYNDIISGSFADKETIYYLNNGNGTFQNKYTLHMFNNNVGKVRVIDINNDNLLDIVTFISGSKFYWSKNNGNGNFEDPNLINISADNSAADFIDINNDGYIDLIYNSIYGQLSAVLNQGGLSFSGNIIIDDIPNYSNRIVAKDIDNDGLIDISIRNSHSIGWYKNNGAGFNQIINVIDGIAGAGTKPFLMEDIQNDGNREFIVADESDMEKLLYFTYDQAENNYVENILDMYIGGAKNVRIFDIDNDGLNDVLSSYRTLVWNKNMGNGNFSSYKILTNVFNEASASYKLEIADLDGDGLKDIIGVTYTKLDIYRNMGNAQFDLAYTSNLTSEPLDIDIADINGDSKPDILITFANTQNGIGKFINPGDFNFGTISYISSSLLGYDPIAISSGDIDNDGDIDIVSVSESNISRHLHVCVNNGNTSFSINFVAEYVSADIIKLVDINNDNYLDIVTALRSSSTATNIYKFMNSSGSYLTPKSVIDTQSLTSLTIGDINGDGYNDIVGASYENFGGDDNDERLITYTYNGTAYDKTIIDNLGDILSLTRDVDLGDLNNDGKLDIATSYFFIGKTSVYLNNTTLNTEWINNDPSGILFYPNPTSGKIYWDKENTNHTITVYNELGQILYNDTPNENYLDLSFLNNGIYFLQLKNRSNIVTKKIIKE